MIFAFGPPKTWALFFHGRAGRIRTSARSPSTRRERRHPVNPQRLRSKNVWLNWMICSRRRSSLRPNTTRSARKCSASCERSFKRGMSPACSSDLSWSSLSASTRETEGRRQVTGCISRVRPISSNSSFVTRGHPTIPSTTTSEATYQWTIYRPPCR
jgi:hypothetical protein